jgi:hypothetical protein
VVCNPKLVQDVIARSTTNNNPNILNPHIKVARGPSEPICISYNIVYKNNKYIAYIKLAIFFLLPIRRQVIIGVTI